MEKSSEVHPTEKQVLEDATKVAWETLNMVTSQVAEAINQKITIDEHVQTQVDRIAQYNERLLDLQTIEKLQGLLEAKSPKSETGSETIYEPALNAKAQNEIAKVIGLIIKKIESQYGTK